MGCRVRLGRYGAVMPTEPRPVPDGEGVFVHEDFEWADVVVDGRVNDGDLRTPIPESLTGAPPRRWREFAERTGRDAAQMWARSRASVTLCADETYPTGADIGTGAYVAEGYVVTGIATKPLVTVRIVCPDGFRVGIVTGPYGEDHDGTESVWDRYCQYSMDGLGRVLSGAYLPQQAGLSLDRAVGSLREALGEVERWVAPQPGVRTSGDTPGWRLVRHALCGGAPGTPGGLLLDHLQTGETVPDSRAAGWWLGDPDDAAWVTAADENDWVWAHITARPDPRHIRNPHSGADWSVRAWETLLGMKQAGWSLAAMKTLHSPAIVQSVARSRAEAQPLVWAEAVHVDRWVTAAGSPADASLCMEAGLGLVEVEQMTAAGAALDLDALRILRALLPPSGS